MASHGRLPEERECPGAAALGVPATCRIDSVDHSERGRRCDPSHTRSQHERGGSNSTDICHGHATRCFSFGGERWSAQPNLKNEERRNMMIMGRRHNSTALARETTYVWRAMDAQGAQKTTNEKQQHKAVRSEQKGLNGARNHQTHMLCPCQVLLLRCMCLASLTNKDNLASQSATP